VKTGTFAARQDYILAHVGAQDSGAMYRKFRGRDAEVGPRGLKAEGKAKKWLLPEAIERSLD